MPVWLSLLLLLAIPPPVLAGWSSDPLVNLAMADGGSYVSWFDNALLAFRADRFGPVRITALEVAPDGTKP